MGGACSKHGKDVKFIKNFVGKPGGKRSLRRPRYGWEERMDLREIGQGVMDWIHLAQGTDQ